MKKRGFVILMASFLLLLTNLVSAQIIFSEVMYDFPGTDTGHEWIEVYNNETNSVNLSQWKLRENNVDHTLTLIQGNSLIDPDAFAILVDNGQNFLSDYLTFQGNIFDSTFSLSNSGEELSLIDNFGMITSNLIYNPDLGADGNNKTLCLYNNSWQECLPTPGNSNIPYYSPEEPDLPEDSNYPLSLSIYLKEPVYLGISYDQLFKISFQNKNCSQSDNVTVEYNFVGPDFSKSGTFSKKVGCSSYADTGEFTPNSIGSYQLCGKIISTTSLEQNYSKDNICQDFTVTDLETISCDLSLTIDNDENLIYSQGQSIEFKPELNDKFYPFTIEYWIEDIFGNLIKNKVTTTNTNQKSWKADISETDRVLFIKAQVNPKCKDLNQSNNYAEKMLIVTNENFIYDSGSNNDNFENNKKNQAESEIKIIKITPEDPTFGELVKAELEIYKGDTGKYSISAWAESGGKEISEKTKINLKDKYQTYKITLPIQLESNCDLKTKEGKATIRVEGLDESAKETISVKGINKKLCSGNSGNGDSKTPEPKETVSKESKSSAQKSDSDDSTISSEETNFPTKASSSSSYAMTASEKALADQSSGIVVYQNSSEKAKKVILYLLVITLGLLCLVLVKKK